MDLYCLGSKKGGSHRAWLFENAVIPRLDRGIHKGKIVKSALWILVAQALVMLLLALILLPFGLREALSAMAGALCVLVANAFCAVRFWRRRHWPVPVGQIVLRLYVAVLGKWLLLLLGVGVLLHSAWNVPAYSLGGVIVNVIVGVIVPAG